MGLFYQIRSYETYCHFNVAVSSIQLSSMKELAIHQIIVNCEKCFILLFKMAVLFDGQYDGEQEIQKI